jgi:hypothetical protein
MPIFAVLGVLLLADDARSQRAATPDLPILPQAENQPAPAAPARDQPLPLPPDANAAMPESTPMPQIMFSFGTYPNSILFTAEQIQQMKEALEDAETRLAAGTPPEPLAVPLAVPTSALMEPPSYPNFYLSSIVYRSPGAWAFWLNGQQYTPKELPPQMQVLDISSESVTLLWQPRFLSDAATRMKHKAFNQTIPTNLLAQQNQPTVVYDPEREGLIFTMRLNQSYVGGAFAVYEGRFGEMPVPQIDADGKVVSSAPADAAQGGSLPPSQAQATSGNVMTQEIQQMLERNQMLGGLFPRAPNSGQQMPPAGAMPPAATPSSSTVLPPAGNTSPPPDRPSLF